MTVTASFTWEKQEYKDIPVINPGAWFGKTWLIQLDIANALQPLYIVEADNLTDAIDEFVDSDNAQWVTIDVEVEGGDYGFAGDDGKWKNLKGESTEEPLSEPYVSGQGVYADIDNLMVYGRENVPNGKGMPFPCRYHTEGLPDKGISPLNYEQWLNWKGE